MSNIFIKKATLSDVEKLQAISKQTFYEAFATVNTEENMLKYLEESFSVEKLTTELSDTNSEFYFASLSHTIIGYLKLIQAGMHMGTCKNLQESTHRPPLCPLHQRLKAAVYHCHQHLQLPEPHILPHFLFPHNKSGTCSPLLLQAWQAQRLSQMFRKSACPPAGWIGNLLSVGSLRRAKWNVESDCLA